MPHQRKFKIGTRVKLTEFGCTQAIGNLAAKTTGKTPAGVVVGYGRNADMVRVLIDSYKSPQLFHDSLWDFEDEWDSI